jgi:hypothetical protein
MEAERWEADAGESVVLGEGAALWERLYERIAQHFGRVEVRARLQRYLAGLLARIDRKNGWQIAEAIGEAGPQGVQRLLNAAVWDGEAVRDELRAYVIEHLGDAASGVLIVDESGFPKEGNASCGVASQYCGTIGSTTNCQTPRGHPASSWATPPATAWPSSTAPSICPASGRTTARVGRSRGSPTMSGSRPSRRWRNEC